MQTPHVENKLSVGNAYAKRMADLIDKAQKDIIVLMFDWRWYPNDPFSDVSKMNHAFVRAARRGVKVRTMTNYLNVVAQLRELGIDAKTWDSTKLMHSKSVVIDGKHVVMGSHNFTNNAMRQNIETSIFIEDEPLAKELTDYFNLLWQS